MDTTLSSVGVMVYLRLSRYFYYKVQIITWFFNTPKTPVSYSLLHPNPNLLNNWVQAFTLRVNIVISIWKKAEKLNTIYHSRTGALLSF